MEKKNIIPQAAKPVVRITQGTQADLLAELSEEVLAGTGADVRANALGCTCCYGKFCSYDGDDAE